MLYRVREGGAVLTQGQVRGLYPNTSFPAVWDQSVCNFIGIDPILASPQPTPSLLETVFKEGVEQDSLGNWVEKWALRPLFSDQMSEDGTAVVKTREEQEQEFLAKRDADQWVIIRSDRNRRLTATDWTQVDDAPMSNIQKAAWASYRQALRDITTQSDPFATTWPEEPN